MGDDPEIEVLYSGESDYPSDTKCPANPSRQAVGAETTTAHRRGSIDPVLHRELFGSSDEFMDASSGSSRSHSNSFDASYSRTTQIVLMMSMALRGVIVAVAILVIAAVVVSTKPICEKSRIVKRYDLLLRTGHVCPP